MTRFIIRIGSKLNLGMILLALSATAWAADCTSVVSRQNSGLISFLSLEARTSEAECVTEAIVKLGDSKDISAVPALIKFLDFPRPESEREKGNLSDMHDKYPAVPALFSIGKPAIPPLIKALQNGELSDAAEQNGVRALMYIYRDDVSAGITLLMRTAKAADSQVRAVRLESYARDSIKYCNKAVRARCEAVLDDTN